MLLISIAVTTSFSEVERQTKLVANLKSMTKRCLLTGQTTFARALADVLRYEALAKRTESFSVERGGSEFDAEISFDDPGDSKPAVHTPFGKGRASESHLYTVTYLALKFDELARFLRETT